MTYKTSKLFSKSNISNLFAKAVIFITLAIMIWITYCSFFTFGSGTSYLQSIVSHPQFLLITGVIVGVCALYLAFKYIDKCSSKRINIIILISALSILLIQLLLIALFDVGQINDQYNVNDEALSVANGMYNQAPFLTSQLVIYGNNYFLFVLTVGLYKVLNFIGFNNYSLALFIFNAVLIDLSLFFLYKIAKLVKNQKFAVKLLVVNVFNPINYIFIFWTYTCTYSLPFMTGIVYLSLLLWKKDYNIIKRVLLGVGISLMIVIGYFLRPVVLIPLIAICICFIIKEKIFSISFVKRYISVFLAMVIVAFGSYSFINSQISKYIPDTSQNYPITHWVMMGLHGNGGYDYDDVSYTRSFDTKEEKTQANIKEIKRTLSEYGVSGTLKHVLNKIPVTWSYSPFDYSISLNKYDRNFSVLYNWFSGEKTDFLSLYSQIFHICMLLFAVFSLIFQIKNKRIDYRFLFTLILLGGIAFYTIWESKSAYSVPFLPLMLIISCDGIDEIKEGVCLKQNLNILKYSLAIALAVTAVFGIANYNNFTENELTFTDKSIYTTDINNIAYIGLSEQKKEITQEFYSSKKVNKLHFLCKAIDESDCSYRIRISDNSGIIKEISVDKKDIKDNYITIDLNGIQPGKKEKYTIQISSLNENDKDSIYWAYRLSAATDQYEGQFKIGDEKQDTDLLIRAYNEYNSPYMSKILYFAFMTILIGCEVLLIYRVNKQIKA
ncbi:MAG: hypothetical protein ACI39F_07115 [Acutalibacteraceae bacterium]